jgi:hypothetical protein
MYSIKVCILTIRTNGNAAHVSATATPVDHTAKIGLVRVLGELDQFLEGLIQARQKSTNRVSIQVRMLSQHLHFLTASSPSFILPSTLFVRQFFF